MPRIAGVDIPNERPLWISLTYIKGVGRTQSKKLLDALQINPLQRAKELPDEDVQKIAGYIERNLIVEGQLERQIRENIQRLKDIRCYRGVRHRQGLPCRGQQTQSNARSKKGPRRTVAGKKSVKGMK